MQVSKYFVFMNLHIPLLPIFASTLQLCSVYFPISFACWSDPMLIPGPTLFLFYLFYSLQDLPCSRPDNTFIFFRNKSLCSGSCRAPKQALLGFTAWWPLRRCSNVLNSAASKRSVGGRSWDRTHHNAGPPTLSRSCSSLSSSMRIWMSSVLSLWPLYHITAGTLILLADECRFDMTFWLLKGICWQFIYLL